MRDKLFDILIFAVGVSIVIQSIVISSMSRDISQIRYALKPDDEIPLSVAKLRKAREEIQDINDTIKVMYGIKERK